MGSAARSRWTCCVTPRGSVPDPPRPHLRDGKLDAIRPDLQLDRLRLNVSRSSTSKPIDPEAHLESVAKLQTGFEIVPAEVHVESGLLLALFCRSTLTPSGMGLVAELVDAAFAQHALVRMLIAPAVGPPARSDSLLLDQMSALKAIRSMPEVSPTVNYRANAIRMGLQQEVELLARSAVRGGDQSVRSATADNAQHIGQVLCGGLLASGRRTATRARSAGAWWADQGTVPASVARQAVSCPAQPERAVPNAVAELLDIRYRKPPQTPIYNDQRISFWSCRPYPQYCDL